MIARRRYIPAAFALVMCSTHAQGVSPSDPDLLGLLTKNYNYGPASLETFQCQDPSCSKYCSILTCERTKILKNIRVDHTSDIKTIYPESITKYNNFESFTLTNCSPVAASTPTNVTYTTSVGYDGFLEGFRLKNQPLYGGIVDIKIPDTYATDFGFVLPGTSFSGWKIPIIAKPSLKIPKSPVYLSHLRTLEDKIEGETPPYTKRTYYYGDDKKSAQIVISVEVAIDADVYLQDYWPKTDDVVETYLGALSHINPGNVNLRTFRLDGEINLTGSNFVISKEIEDEILSPTHPACVDKGQFIEFKINN
ncbi:MAG: hypothetical protein M9905_03585 [Rhizobiaceae bacterium]|nr:hypothetical protein [Rhizobiaceae bacterium]